MNKFTFFILLTISALSARAQTFTDGLIMSKKNLCTGFLYTHDQWTNYWEGTLRRTNQNIGTITTQSTMWMGAYGISKNLNIIAMLPYVWTKASSGTLHSMQGFQDLSVALKYNFFIKEFEKSKFSAFGVGAFSTPVSNYTPDFLPLSIGLASKNVIWRFTANFAMKNGVYINASGGYTWRSNITLDRDSYYTDGKFYLSKQVRMPNVMDYVVSAGYNKRGLQAELYYAQQNTLAGGDIRRQDMPFASNKMNFSKIGLTVMYRLPGIKNLLARGSVVQTLAGRNVGQSTTFIGGLLYTIRFSNQQ